jgi:folate-dependent phosphoribosylglycinamide formyltransferase PurN
MRTLLICHEDDALNRHGLSRWLNSFSDLVGIVAVSESKQRLWQRIRREIRRVGVFRFLDVLAYRLYARLALRNADSLWEAQLLDRLKNTFPALHADIRILHTHSPNTPQAEQFLRECAPELVIARCKSLLKERVFTLPAKGTFVMHPGICPEYRNAHGCFWALAKNDDANVGMTLLQIDKGVDTGPVYGYFHCDFDSLHDSHTIIQHKVVFDNLEAIKAKLLDLAAGSAQPIPTAGRASLEWGQPWLSAYWHWKRRARRELAQRAAVMQSKMAP